MLHGRRAAGPRAPLSTWLQCVEAVSPRLVCRHATSGYWPPAVAASIVQVLSGLSWFMATFAVYSSLSLLSSIIKVVTVLRRQFSSSFTWPLFFVKWLVLPFFAFGYILIFTVVFFVGNF